MSHLGDTGRNLDLLSANYDVHFLIDDCNVELTYDSLKPFCDLCKPKNVEKVTTCPKNQNNLLTLRHGSRKTTLTILKIHFEKNPL